MNIELVKKSTAQLANIGLEDKFRVKLILPDSKLVVHRICGNVIDTNRGLVNLYTLSECDWQVIGKVLVGLVMLGMMRYINIKAQVFKTIDVEKEVAKMFTKTASSFDMNLDEVCEVFGMLNQDNN